MDARTPVDLLASAKETYRLEHSLSQSHDDALSSAISAALEAHRAQVISEVADQLEEYVLAVAEDDEVSSDTIGHLMYAIELVEALGVPEGEIAGYNPESGDVVQLVVSGRVKVHKTGSVWFVDLDRGDRLMFDLNEEENTVRVRLLDREG